MKKLASVLLIALLAACGGGSSTIPTASTQAKTKTVPASIVIKIPAASAASKSKRPAYVSASTQSISGSIAPAAGCTACSSTLSIAANLTPSSSGCSTGGSGTTCTIAIALSPGSYIASLSTYSGTLSGGVPTGSELSTDQSVPVTIAVNTANTVSLTMGGIPTQIAIAGANGTLNSSVNGAGGHVYLDGPSSSMTVTVTPEDASGNAIIGPGAPTMSFSVTGGNGFGATASGANAFVATAPAKGTTGVDYVNVTFASGTTGACSASNADCTSQQVSLQFLQRVAGTANVSSTSGYVWESPIAYQAQFLNMQSISSSGPDPRFVAFDSKGNLFVGDQGNGNVYEYTFPLTSTSTPSKTISPGGNLVDIAIDGSDNLIVADSTNILEYDQPAYTTSHTVSGSAIAGASTLATASNGTLYVVIGGASGTAKIIPFAGGAPYATAGTSFSSGLNFPNDAHVDASGNVWIANTGSTPTNGTVTEYSSSGSLLTTITTGTTPIAISVDSLGDVAMDDGNGVNAYMAGAYGTTVLVSGTAASPLWMLDTELIMQGGTGQDIYRCFSLAPVSCGDLLIDVSSVGTTAGVIFKYPMALWP